MRPAKLELLMVSGSLLMALSCTSGPIEPSGPRAASGPAQVAPTLPASAARTEAVETPSVAAPPSRPVVVRTARTQGVGNILYLAAVRGYFQEQGIELERVEFRNAAEALPALATGELDAGSSAPVPSFINALARGVRLTLALDASHVDPKAKGYPLVSRLQDGQPVVQSLADLRGKRVAHSTPGYPGERALERMLAEVGLTFADFADNQYMGFPDTLAAFAGGSIDLSVMVEPWGAIAEDRGVGVRVRDVGDFIPGAPVAMIVFSEQFARNRPAAQGFAVAYVRAAREYADAWEYGKNRDAVLAILAEFANISPRVLEKSGYLAVRRDGRVDTDELVAWVDWLAERGYVPEKPDIRALVNNQFAEYATRVLDGPSPAAAR